MKKNLVKKLIGLLSTLFLFSIIQFALCSSAYGAENIFYQSTFDNFDGINSLMGSWSTSNGDLIPNSSDQCRLVFDGTNKSDYEVTLNATFLSGNNGTSGYGIYFRATN